MNEMLHTTRGDGRMPDALRPVSFEFDFAPAATGSVLIAMGHTRVICAVNIEPRVPRWMQQQKVEGGWLSATYSMLPYAGSDRSEREASRGKLGGRTQEIQRLIGRSLRAAIDLKALGSNTIWIDCDVVEADGGTRTASITGSWLALRCAINKLLKEGRLEQDPLGEPLAAISAGLVHGQPLLDLCYEEDLAADVDLNCVMSGGERFVEVQGTAEGAPYSHDELTAMLNICQRGIQSLIRQGQEAMKATGN